MTEIQSNLMGDVQASIAQAQKEDNLRIIAKRIKRLTYSQDWTSYNLSKTQGRILSEKLLLELLDSFYDSELRTTSSIPIKERIYCMFMYVYSGFSSRKLISELTLAKERGILKKVVHFNTVLNFFHSEELTKILRKLIYITSLPLKNIEKDFAVDSSGFSTSQFSRWVDIRTQEIEVKRLWKKCHISVGVKSKIVCAIEITNGSESDCPYLIPLVQRLRKNFELVEVSADKAYLSRANLQFIAEQGAIPYIPFKSNSNRNARGSALWTLLYDYFLNNTERWNESYHKRSLVESTFGMIKKNFGNNLKTKKDIPQINEIMMKCICHNLCVLIGTAFKSGLNIDLLSCKEEYEANESKDSGE